MKRFRHTFCFILAALFAGCTTSSTSVVNEPVGPDLAAPRVNLGERQGRLMVYSATEVDDAANAYFPVHSAYTISDAGGKLLRHVDNRTGSFEQTPVTVPLPAGNYKVRARATNAGTVEVPVVIKEGKTTVVDLEGATLPQRRPTGAGQWVRLPNGQVIGMRVE
jgi:hypothetical protein